MSRLNSDITPFGPPVLASSEVILPANLDAPNAILGSGHFGTVFRGKCRGLNVAIKKLKSDTIDAQALQAFRAEVNTMAQIAHPNVCLFMGACFEPDNLMIVTELCEGGDVQKLLQSEAKISVLEKVRMAGGAARGVNWLHNSNPRFIHRDLKTSNLLLDANRNVKVCDFGLSQLIPQNKKMRDLRRAKGTPLYMAPEVMMFEPFDERSDIYSFGIVLWEIFTRMEPFLEFNDIESFRTAVTKHHARPVTPAEVLPRIPLRVQDLMTRCWQGAPAQRPPMAQVVDELDAIALEVAIPKCQAGRQFWVEQFGDKSRVTKSALLDALQTYVQFQPAVVNGVAALSVNAKSADGDLDMAAGESAASGNVGDPPLAAAQHIADAQFRLLSALLDDIGGKSQSKELVSVEQFGQVLNWFGPLDPLMLQRIYDVCSEPWFHGAIETIDAEARVTGQVPNTFLIRLSTTAEGAFTLSYKTAEGDNRSSKHKRLQLHYNQDGSERFFLINSSKYDTLQAIIEATRLYPPAPGSKYQQLVSGQSGDPLYTPSSGYE